MCDGALRVDAQSFLFDQNSICRDEWCEIDEIHLAHKVRQKREPKPRSDKPPWLLPAREALDESILKAVSDVRPKHFAQIVSDVENDYGTLAENRRSGMRRVHRHLRTLVNMGAVLRIEIGEMLFAYLKPTSRIASDVGFVREQILESISEGSGRKAFV